MRQAANITSIHALKDFKLALSSFATVINTALGEARSDLQRTTWWVQQSQATHWKVQKRKRTVQLAQAKSELFRAQVASNDQRASTVLERRAAEKAQHRLDEADKKLANISRWSRLLEREVIIYRGQTQQLARVVEGEVPRALMRLDKMLDALEKYVRTQAPDAGRKAVEEVEAPDEARQLES